MLASWNVVDQNKVFKILDDWYKRDLDKNIELLKSSLEQDQVDIILKIIQTKDISLVSQYA